VHDGWEFGPVTVAEFAGGYALEIGDDETTMVWLEIPDADLALYENQGQDVNDLWMFLDKIEVE
jgi:hypothetical protein